MNLERVSIGVDIETISRFKGKSQAFYAKIFTVDERKYCDRRACPEQHYAVRFCAKEAFIKALTGLGVQSTAISMKEIEISHDDSGCPIVHYNGSFPMASKVSLSHDRTKAMASVLITRD